MPKTDTVLQKLKSYQALQTNINFHDLMFHVFKQPVSDDYTYDKMKAEYRQLQRDYPTLSDMAPKARSIAEQITANGRITKHDFPMLEYRETNDLHGLRRWFETVDTKGGIIVEPTVSGIAIELVYVGGALHKAVSFGDGLTGIDLTLNMYSVNGVPQQIAETERVNIHGVVTMAVADHIRLGPNNVENVKPLIVKHLRNTFTEQRNKDAVDALHFIPTMVNIPGVTLDLMDLRAILTTWEFTPAPGYLFNGRCRDVSEYEEGIDAFYAQQVNDYPYLVAGLSFKVDDTHDRLTLGYTSRFPEWAINYKGKTNGSVKSEVKDQSVDTGADRT